MKSKRILMVFVAIVLLVTAITVPVAAYMIKKTGSFESNFTPSTVECKVNEKFENLVKESITVTNLGDIDAYVRVKLVTYYVDEDGNVLANKTATIADFTLGDGWLKGSDNTYYYKTKVGTTGTTSDLLGTSITLANGQVVIVLAEAIQADPTDAVTNAWGVTIENGVITSDGSN